MEYEVVHVQVPTFLRRQVFTNVVPGANVVPSGTVTSAISCARAQAGGPEVTSLMVTELTTQAESEPPASENSSERVPVVTVTWKEVFAQAPAAVSTSPR